MPVMSRKDINIAKNRLNFVINSLVPEKNKHQIAIHELERVLELFP